jgi:hypothetical protein
LTDNELNIQTLLRTHKYEDDVLIAVNQKYPIENAKQLRDIDSGQLSASIASLRGENSNKTVKTLLNDQTGITLSLIINNDITCCIDLGTLMIEHALLTAGLSPSITVGEFGKVS